MKTYFLTHAWPLVLCWLLLPVAAFATNDVTVSNTTYTTTQTVSADNSITATPAVVVANGANVTFQAGGLVTLGSGFSVATGGLFHVSVGQLQPFIASFETADGYTAGSVNSQLGWSVTQGAASVTTADHSAGSQSLALQSGGTAAVATAGFVVSTAPAITFVDLYAKPVAAATAATSSLVQTEATKVGFQTAGGLGEVYCYDGASSQWLATGYRFYLNGSNQATDWLRITLRIDYTNKKWDLYADGVMINYDLGFSSASETFFRQLSLSGVTSAASYVDDIYASDTNPLFTDANKDGMDDAWETAHGITSRNGDADGDGLINIQEYVLRTDPSNADVTPPSAPTNLVSTFPAPTSLNLSWSASTDTGAGTPGIAGYHLYRNGVKANTSIITGTSYTDINLIPSTSYTYTVRAVDLAGNLSGASSPLTVTTPADYTSLFEVFTPFP